MFVKDYALNLGLTFSKRWSILILVSIILVVEGEVMSTVNLLILGVLMEQPMNAYEMQKLWTAAISNGGLRSAPPLFIEIL